MNGRCVYGDNRKTMRAMIDAGERVQMCVTSPPYFGLRSYLDQDSADKSAELGSEPTVAEYVANMVDVFRLVRELLADDGTLWLNLGDSYTGAANSGGAEGQRLAGPMVRVAGLPTKRGAGLKPKDLIGIPWRVAFALQADGWYLRSDIIWAKPNPMPESVTDRPTKAHEYLFLLSKRPTYYYDAAAIAEPAAASTVDRAAYRNGGTKDIGNYQDGQRGRLASQTFAQYAEGGRNRRTVWTVATQPYSGAHFATFPPALIEPCILAGTSERGACPSCGRQWARMTEHVGGDTEAHERPKRTAGMDSGTSTLSLSGNGSAEWAKRGGKTRTVGWEPTCVCGVDPVAPVVFDPFLGSGTTGEVATRLGRRWLGCELNEDYRPLIDERTAQLGLPLAVNA